MRKSYALIVINVILVFCFLSDLNAQNKNSGYGFTLDESGIPMSNSKFHFVDKEEIKNDMFIRNTTEFVVKVYSYQNGKLKSLGKVKNDGHLYMPKDKIKNAEFFCLEILDNSENNDYCVTVTDHILTEITMGMQSPSWNGGSYDELKNEIIKQNLPKKNTDFIIQSVSTSRPNSAGGVDVNIEFWNTGKKTIKYVYFTVEPYNTVDDVTISEINGKSQALVQVSDYIGENKFYIATWENVWYNNSIAYAKIKHIKIIYKDNSEMNIGEKEIPNISGINPICCELVKNNIFSIMYLYNNGRVYCYLISDYKFDKFNIVFETATRMIHSKTEKDIRMTLEKKDVNNNIVRLLHPNYRNKLLYETLSISITYKIAGKPEERIRITDRETIEKIQNYAYVIEQLGLM